jgi:hypothetical protein
MKAVDRVSDDRIAFRVERDNGDRIPVSGVPCPAPRGSCPGMLVERMASLQEGVVIASMSLCRADIADGTITVLVAVLARPRLLRRSPEPTDSSDLT